MGLLKVPEGNHKGNPKGNPKVNPKGNPKGNLTGNLVDNPELIYKLKYQISAGPGGP